MSETRKEIEAKLLKANSVEEVMGIMKDAGVETNAEEAQKTFEKVKELRGSDGKELSIDELDAVAGGVTYRHWIQDGCAGTVEPGSSCWGTDGGCDFVNISYFDEPCNQPCIYCGAPYTVQWEHLSGMSNAMVHIYQCRECGKKFRYNRREGKWEEYMY